MKKSVFYSKGKEIKYENVSIKLKNSFEQHPTYTAPQTREMNLIHPIPKVNLEMRATPISPIMRLNFKQKP